MIANNLTLIPLSNSHKYFHTWVLTMYTRPCIHTGVFTVSHIVTERHANFPILKQTNLF